MIEVLDKPSTRARVGKLSVMGYHHLFERGLIGEKNELIRGVIIEKMPKSPEHIFAIIRLMEKFRQLFSSGYCLRKEDPMTLQDSEPEPDLAVVKGADVDFAKQHPSTARLVVEVSKTTYDLDYDKQFLYAEASIPEYWLVNLEKAETEVYTKPDGGRYMERKIFPKGSAIPIEGSSINVDEIY